MAEWENGGGKVIRKAIIDAGSSFPPSGSKIKAVVAECMNYSKEYKFIVHELERYIRKATKSEQRIIGLYAIDAVCRKTQDRGGIKDPMLKRFGDKMSGIIGFIDLKNDNEKIALSKVCSGWVERKSFGDNLLQSFKSFIIASEEKTMEGDHSSVIPPPPPPSKPRSSRFTDADSSTSSSTNVSMNIPTITEQTLPNMSSSGSSSSSSSSNSRVDPRKRKKMKTENDMEVPIEENISTLASTLTSAPVSVPSSMNVSTNMNMNMNDSSQYSRAYERLLRNVRNIQGRNMNASSMTNYLTSGTIDAVVFSEVPSPVEPIENELLYPPSGLVALKTLPPAEAEHIIREST